MDNAFPMTIDLQAFPGCGTFIWRASDDRLICSDGLQQILHADPQSMADFIALMAPADGVAFAADVAIAPDTEPPTRELRFSQARGHGPIVNIRLHIDRSDPVTGNRIQGLVVDVTPSRQKQVVDTSTLGGGVASDAFNDLIESSPFGIVVADADLRVVKVSKGGMVPFAGIDPVIGRDLAELIRIVWPEPFATEMIANYRHTIDTGEPFRSGAMAAHPRENIDTAEAYDWRLDRIILPDGRRGVVCNFYDISAQANREATLAVQKAASQENARDLRSILDNCLAFVGLLDTDGTLLEANAPALEAGGLARDDVIGQKFWDASWWSHDAAAVAQLKAAVETARAGTAVRYDADVRMRENRIMSIDFLLSPVVDAQGNVTRLVASGFDITERLKSEHHVRLLMGEINHRSKNVLTLVQSVARLTERSRPEEFVSTFGHRLQALAQSYDLLLKEQTHDVELGAIAHAQLAHFQDMIGSRITLTGPPVRVSADAAQALGMAFHELATNAGKYGALSNDAGAVNLVWRMTEPRSGEPMLDIRWTETNGPPVVVPEDAGFGTMVLTTMARSALGGEVALDYNTDGIVWHVTGADVCISR